MNYFLIFIFQMEKWISSLLGVCSTEKIFDNLMMKITDFTTTPCHSLTEIRAHRPTKIRGDLFEDFCKLWLESKYSCQVWKLADLPTEKRQEMALPSNDVGIDLIVYFPSTGKHWAVQCKWRDPKNVTRVTWKDLSTFLLLCARTGEWDKHVVMTNMRSISWKGRKNTKDHSICYQSFVNTPHHVWCQMVKQTIPQPLVTCSLTPEEVRARRLAYFNNN